MSSTETERQSHFYFSVSRETEDGIETLVYREVSQSDWEAEWLRWYKRVQRRSARNDA